MAQIDVRVRFGIDFPYWHRQGGRVFSVEFAREEILRRLVPLPAVRVPLSMGYGRVLSEDMCASSDLPRFDNSAMDGYAVRAADLAAASSERPVTLRLCGRVAAGGGASPAVEPGTCVRVFTGAPLPLGADSVVMQEDTRIASNPPEWVEVLDAVRPWENVRLRGEDIKQGATVLKQGERLNAARVGLAAALGVSSVPVHGRPRVALLATGDELVEVGKGCGSGQIYESNRLMLAPLLSEVGVVAPLAPAVADTLDGTTAALQAAWKENDAVISCGGVSVGEADWVKPALEALGGRIDFWRVAIKPGKPFVFGECDGKYLFGLPGNPVSALVTFLMLVRPALLRWQGARRVEPRRYWVAAGEAVENRGNRRLFLRALLDDAGRARLSGPQASHVLGSLSRADGFLELGEGVAVREGDPVAFYPLEE